MIVLLGSLLISAAASGDCVSCTEIVRQPAPKN